MSDLDAIVIGAGHNGLTCAAYLAMAGLRVRVVERRGIVGGAAVTEEFHPGFRNSTAAYTVSLLQPKIIRDLKLHQHGLRIVERRAQNFLPLPDGRYLLTGEGRTVREIAKFSIKDAERYPAYQANIGRVAEVLRGLMLQAPPNLALSGFARAMAELGKLAVSRQEALASRGLQGGVRSPAQIGRRDPRRLVRFPSDQGGARLRCRRRQFGKSLHAGLRLCAAASHAGRGERQERRMGPRHRRHGGYYSGHGQGRGRARRAHRRRLRGARGHHRARPRHWRRAGGRHADPRPRGDRQRGSAISVSDLWCRAGPFHPPCWRA